MNVTEYEQIFFNGATAIFGNSLIVIAFLFFVFAYLIIKSKLSLEASALVFMPTIVGLTIDKWLPLWIKGLFLISIGFIWGLAIIRVLRGEQ